MRNVARVLFLGALACCPLWTQATEQTAQTFDAAGQWTSNTTQRAVSAVAQPGTVGVSRNSRYTHYAGFLGGAFIQPGNTNAQGIALEASPDNDGDGLLDGDEISGAAFGGHAQTDPNSPDSDNDGMSDADEAAGMYDPNDPGHLLSIIALDRTGGNYTLRWIGKGGGTVNTVFSGDDLTEGPFTNVLYTSPYGGGTYPWYKATNIYPFSASGTTNLFLRVQTE